MIAHLLQGQRIRSQPFENYIRYLFMNDISKVCTIPCVANACKQAQIAFLYVLIEIIVTQTIKLIEEAVS